jgi:sugar transferase (PEP-CTERM/EpsH1 system associated)
MAELISKPRHIAHVVYSFSTGGLENGVVNIINNLPEKLYQHSIVCVTGHDELFFSRIKTTNVKIYDLHKPQGRDVLWLYRCWKLLKYLNPDICHTRNLSAIEAQLPAWLARIPERIHGEHGWDVFDIGGTNTKYQRLRSVFKPLINKYVGLSLESIEYLVKKIQVKPTLISHICNGVDIHKFSPQTSTVNLPEGFKQEGSIVFGTVGRLAEVKNQTFLVEAFCHLWVKYPELQNKLRLVIVGDGVLLPKLRKIVSAAKVETGVWLTGRRDDVSELMNAMDVFVLPSLAEGIPNTMLEAMASGLPAIATNVGGNPDLILPQHADTHIVEVNNIKQLSGAMEVYIKSKEQIAIDSELVRQHCVDNFSIEVMVDNYHHLYQTSSFR